MTDIYCITCGRIARCVVNEHFHLVPARAYAICKGPFAYCPPPDDEGAFSFPEQEEADDPDNYIFESFHYLDDL